MINKYEDAGILEDEAQDAIEDLKEIKEAKKKIAIRRIAKNRRRL